METDEINIIKDKKKNTTRHYSHRINKEYKTKECKVINYNAKTKVLDIYFDTYGIRLSNVDSFEGQVVNVKYIGEIGKPNFKIEL